MRIKRIIVVVLFAVTGSFAKVSVGIICGLNISTLKSSPRGLLSITYDKNIGAGLLCEYLAEDNFSLTLGTVLLNKGSNFTIEGQDDVTAVTRLHYFSLPLTLHYNFKSEGLIHPYILGGIFGEYQLKSSRTYHTPDGIVNVNMNDQIDRYNYGYLLGGGLEWIRGKNTIYIETQYSLGRHDIDITNDIWKLSTRGV